MNIKLSTNHWLAKVLIALKSKNKLKSTILKLLPMIIMLVIIYLCIFTYPIYTWIDLNTIYRKSPIIFGLIYCAAVIVGLIISLVIIRTLLAFENEIYDIKKILIKYIKKYFYIKIIWVDEESKK